MPQNVEKVCIIDDDRIYVNLVSRVIALKKLSKEVIIFKNGKEAIDFFKQNIKIPQQEADVPKIILLDLNMPIMDGWEFLQEFEQIKSNINQQVKLYVVSSSINPRDVDRAKSIEAVSDYIIKPIQMQDFERIFKS